MIGLNLFPKAEKSNKYQQSPDIFLALFYLLLAFVFSYRILNMSGAFMLVLSIGVFCIDGILLNTSIVLLLLLQKLNFSFIYSKTCLFRCKSASIPIKTFYFCFKRFDKSLFSYDFGYSWLNHLPIDDFLFLSVSSNSLLLWLTNSSYFWKDTDFSLSWHCESLKDIFSDSRWWEDGLDEFVRDLNFFFSW